MAQSESSTQTSTQLAGKKIFVTGGSRGIGAAIVQNLARHGAQVALSYRSEKAKAEDLIRSLGSDKHFAVHLDLADTKSIQSAAAEVLQKLNGEIQGLVNNAGLTRDKLFLRMSADDFDQVVSSNLRGTFLLTQAFSKTFLKQRAGSIVNLSSVIARTGNPGQTNYAASKAGLEGFTRSLAAEIASRFIRVNCVAPGFIESEMTSVLTEDQKTRLSEQIPLGRVGTPDEVAHLVRFLLSDESCYITGQTIGINGGMFMI